LIGSHDLEAAGGGKRGQVGIRPSGGLAEHIRTHDSCIRQQPEKTESCEPAKQRQAARWCTCRSQANASHALTSAKQEIVDLRIRQIQLAARLATNERWGDPDASRSNVSQLLLNGLYDEASHRGALGGRGGLSDGGRERPGFRLWFSQPEG